MNRHEQYTHHDDTLGEARRSATEEKMFLHVRREREERERCSAEKGMLEEARKKRRQREKREREQEEKLVDDISQHGSSQGRGDRAGHSLGENGLSGHGKEKEGNYIEEEINRRSFLKKMLWGGAALLGAGTLWKGHESIYRFLSDWEEKKKVERLRKNEEEQKREFARFVRQTGDIISPERETFLNVDTMDALTEYWKDIYTGNKEKVTSAGEKIVYDIAGAYKRMLPYDEKIRNIFKREGVLEDLRLLSIVESGWNEQTMGEKYNEDIAGGPFQFTGFTGKAYGLSIDRDRGIDERFDALRSAHAAARYLKWMLEGNGHNSDFALHEYNGGFALRYRDSLLKKNLRITSGKEKGQVKEPSYEEFLTLMEEGIQKRKEELFQKKNGREMFEDDIQEGMRGGVLGNYKENIEYTAKVRAVIELVNDRKWRKMNGYTIYPRGVYCVFVYVCYTFPVIH